MKKASLPFVNPPVTSFLRWAYTLGIICAHEGTRDWVLNNFIQLTCNTCYGQSKDGTEPERHMMLDFWRGPQTEMLGNNPFLDCRAFGYEKALHGLTASSVVELAGAAICEGFYPVLFVDESKLHFSTGYGSNLFFPHHVLLHSIHEEEKSFTAASFGRPSDSAEYGRFGSYPVQFGELEQSVLSMEAVMAKRRFEGGLNFLLRFRRPTGVFYEQETELRPEVIRDAIQAYISSTTGNLPNLVKKGSQVYGSAVFEEVARYFDQVTNGTISTLDRRDVRHLALLEEHHRLMAQRVTELAHRGFIRNNYSAEDISSAFMKIVQELQLLKLKIMMRHSWQAAANFDAVALKLRGMQKKSVDAMESVAEAISG